jgi:glucose/arabinose dehydrogenase
MMRLALSLAALAGLASAASAQNSVAPAASAPAAAPAPAMPAAPAAPVALSLDTPIEALMADPRAKAVLDARLPTLATHPAYNMIKAMNLRQVQPYSQGALTDEILAAIGTDLAAIH